ncbi:hypothetical protein ACMHYB_14335 [Sorangium sp. So ce1128]|uniref:Secreted protein n=1 Tax=Sorangium cellulosum TaxID=56 RepID=A0A3S5GYB2_SORCE|nr:hypothetical protein [Sorangium cellulosum]
MDKTSFLLGPPPRGRRLLARLCAGALAAASLVGGASRADATVAISSDIERTGKRRPSSQSPLWISREDCLTDNDLLFTITLSPGSYSRGDTLSVWVSETVDCRLRTERDSDGDCVMIEAKSDLDSPITFRVPAEKIASALRAPDCNDPGPSTSARPVSIYFLHQESSQEDVGADDSAVWTDTKMDLLGPRPPTNVKVGSGDTRLIVEYSRSSDEDTFGHYFYCDSNIVSSPGSGGGGAGAGGAAGAGGGAGDGGGGGGGAADDDAAGGGGDDGGDGDSSCGSSVLVPGEIPDPSLVPCGRVGRASAGEASGLDNGIPYAVGVAAYDNIGNPGVLSELGCGMPVDVDSFFELYREAGGEAGGGFCSVAGPVGAGRWLPVPLGAMVAGAALGLWRRTRRRRARPSAQEHG